MRLCRINRPKAAIITVKQRLLIMVEKCEAEERECACRGAIRLPDEQSEEPCEARSQEAAREHQPSEFFQNRAEGRKGSAAQSKRDFCHTGGSKYAILPVIQSTRRPKGIDLKP